MFEKLKAILVEDMSVNEHDITMEAELISDLGLNSLELADLVMLCEERFELEFDEAELKNLLTVRDVVNYLELNANI
ncbi:MAG: acyl carrier protein [Ruminococcaceae bacterium]|nr:acyl carrier protein [Oscillospiraceae bacterium]